MDPSDTRSWHGVVVLGSHRSGTSAVTGVINSLGLPACRADDRFELRPWNARGNFESASISAFDDALLRLLGGQWWAPPLPGPGWAESIALDQVRANAALVFANAHPAGRWVWKDPRACVLMQFWDLVFEYETPRIVVLRSPDACAASLARRNLMPLHIALAMTERNLRTALRDSAGKPVWITAYDELLDDTAAWCRKAASLVRIAGESLDEPLPINKAEAFLDSSLRHHRDRPADEDSTAPAGVQRLWVWAMERSGLHESFSIEGLPDESADTAPAIADALRTFVPREDGRVPMGTLPGD